MLRMQQHLAESEASRLQDTPGAEQIFENPPQEGSEARHFTKLYIARQLFGAIGTVVDQVLRVAVGLGTVGIVGLALVVVT